MRIKAFVRREIIDQKMFPYSSKELSFEEWETFKFYCYQLDDDDPTAFSENDHPDGCNMIILHPITYELIWVYSIDFDFM